MADDNIIRLEEVPRKPPYPRSGLNGLQFLACDTGDAQSNVEQLGATAAFRGIEVVGTIPYNFNAQVQPGFIVVIYDPKNDPFYDDDPVVHPPDR